jgi:hypothetical protein
MLTPELPEHCPCGGWPSDPGEPIPEIPGLYNHRVLTHPVAFVNGEWVATADLPRIKTTAERAAETDAEEKGAERLTNARKSWEAARTTSTNAALNRLIEMHEPLMNGRYDLYCNQCWDEGGYMTSWPCESWRMLLVVMLRP